MKRRVDSCPYEITLFNVYYSPEYSVIRHRVIFGAGTPGPEDHVHHHVGLFTHLRHSHQ